MNPFAACLRALVAGVIALAAASCGPSVQGFDGAFPDSDPNFSDVTTDSDVVFDETNPVSCSGYGTHCNANEDCCSNYCSLGVHQCM